MIENRFLSTGFECIRGNILTLLSFDFDYFRTKLDTNLSNWYSNQICFYFCYLESTKRLYKQHITFLTCSSNPVPPKMEGGGERGHYTENQTGP